MKKNLFILGIILCFCLVCGTAFADNTNFGSQNGPMQGMPMCQGNGQGPSQGMPMGPENGPMGDLNGMNMMIISSDLDSVNLLADSDSDSDIVDTLEGGTMVRIIEEDGDYVKVDIMGTTGYILSKYLSDEMPEPPAMPGDGNEPSAKPEDGSEPPAKPEDGSEPPSKPENNNGQSFQPGNDNGQPFQPGNSNGQSFQPGNDNGQSFQLGNDNGQSFQPGNSNGQSRKSEVNKDQNSDSLEPGFQNFFKALFQYLSGNHA